MKQSPDKPSGLDLVSLSQGPVDLVLASSLSPVGSKAPVSKYVLGVTPRFGGGISSSVP